MKKISLLTFLFFIALKGVHYFTEEKNHSNFKDSLTEKEYSEEAEEEKYGEEEEEEEKKVDQPDKFLLFHRGIRTRDGERSPGYSLNYKWIELRHARTNYFARKRRATGRTKSNGVLEWKERGPGNVPGRTRALFNIPGDPDNNTWLAGAATGGIWRTENGGTSWTEKSADFPALPISGFAADANATVIYAGTGEFVSSVFSAIGNGIFKSTDKGQTWSQLPSTNNHPDFSIITRLIVDPDNANIIVATTVPHNMSLDQTSAIMRSTDGGSSWTKVEEITGFFEQIVATPGNFNVQYASQNQVGVWKSTDAGITWNLSNNGMSPAGRVEIAVSPVSPNKVFASAEGTLSGVNSDLYYSPDAGNTWSLVDVKFNNATVDFFEGQGFYDNTIMCDPFDANKVYFGGVSLFRTTLGTTSEFVDNYKIEEVNTQSFLFLQAFANIPYDNQRLDVGTLEDDITVEIRFGPGESQKAHRFTVPAGATSGIDVNDYSYKNYVNVPFEVWDVTNNRQLMLSFRDQNQNGKFDLVESALQDTDPANLQSREYVYINDVTYNPSFPNANMDQAGGQAHRLMYNFFPALAEGAVWNENALPVSKLVIKNNGLQKFNATTVTAADGRGSFDNKNGADQENLAQGVHPDHHCMQAVIINQSSKTFKILLGNDGGVFVSKVSANPGITEGDWSFRGLGLNTSQFYGADKKPGADEYIGGMQDNGTRFSPAGESASALSEYIYGIGGDGFEVLWHSKDPGKILGSVYNGQISRTLDGGNTWQNATSGLTPGSEEFSFVTKLAHSKDFPDRVFTVGRQGVYVSENFGETWELSPVTEKFLSGENSPFFLDVEVSRANANIVWAGTGMFNSAPQRNLHVSADGGKTFTVTSNYTEVPMGNITRLASHPADENTAYALFSFANAPKILRTTNKGQSWEDISGFGTGTSSTNGFPDVAVYCLYVRTDNPDILWAGTEIGIVESVDNGQTWALIDDFPNVSVWDMKGQDQQVVIATHGRGIWTANLETSQNPAKLPEITVSGTSPQEDLMLRIETLESFDSIQIYIGSDYIKTMMAVQPGIADVALSSVSAGEKEVRLISYKGTSPYQSSVTKVNQLDILPVASSYSTYFNTINDLTVDGLTHTGFPNSSSLQRKGLHTDHNYSLNTVHEVIVRTPVTVSTDLPVLYYSDIAIIEPGHDSVVVEATKNGLDWTLLSPAYDASFDGDVDGLWQNAFTDDRPGTIDMLIKHEIDLSEKFSADDVLLFRWRMLSGPAITSWGWAIDYISIQELPVASETPARPTSLSLYPNPTQGQFTIEYDLKKRSEVSVSVIDVFGRTVSKKDLGVKPSGTYSETVNLENLTRGTYLVIVNAGDGKKAGKIVFE